MSGVMHDEYSSVEPVSQMDIKVVNKFTYVRIAIFVTASKISGKGINNDQSRHAMFCNQSFNSSRNVSGVFCIH